MEVSGSEKRRKAKDRVVQLSEHRKGLYYNVIAQYGTRDDQRFVVNVEVDGEIFQGVGPSRKRAKTMAAELALAHLGALDATELEKPDLEEGLDGDMTADFFGSSGLLYKFADPEVDPVKARQNVTPLMAVETGYEEGAYDEYEFYVGRNSLSMLSELRSDATYRLVYESRNVSKSKFVMTVKVDGQIFRGEAPSKKLAKARAARDALQAVLGIDFGHSEDGMPIYEGTGSVWQEYKEKLERESYKLVGNFSAKNPVAQLHELFPDTKYEFPDEKVEYGGFFTCKVIVNGTEYDGIGTSKKDAKSNAASNALEELRVSGLLDQRLKEIEDKKKAKAEKLKELEKEKPDSQNKAKNRLDKVLKLSSAPAKNAISKLNELFAGLEYKVVGEMPLRNTNMIAFAVSVFVSGRTYIGIGKNKKLAKMEAAEKALRAIGLWTDDDEYMKLYALRGDPQLEEDWAGGQEWRRDVPPLMSLMGGQRGGGPGMRGPIGGREFGFGGGDAFQGGYDDAGWGEEEEYGFDEFGGQQDVMIFKLSSIVAQLLEKNPQMGPTDIWNKLQLDESWQGDADTWQEETGFGSSSSSWQTGTRRGFGVGRGGGFGRGGGVTPSFIGGASTPSRGGRGMTSQSRGNGFGSQSFRGSGFGGSTQGRGRGFGGFSNTSYDGDSYAGYEEGPSFGSGFGSGRGLGGSMRGSSGRGGHRGAMSHAMGRGRGQSTSSWY